MIILLFIFWASAILIIYTYLGYPILIAFLARLYPQRVNDLSSSKLPTVCLIIAAHNEEKVIREKIGNSLSIDYPEALFSIVTVSDGSTDRTNEIVNEFAPHLKIKFINYQPRRGKANALNMGVANSESEIIVFSDANIRYEPDSVKYLVRDFFDPSAGCVCGKVLLEKPKESKEPIGEGAYMKYERFIHQNESRFNTMIGTDGAMYAIRRELFKPLPEDAIVDDFIIAMRVLEKGYRIVYEPKAIGYEEAASSVNQEFKRKVRMIAGGFQAVGILGSVLNPFLDPIVFFQFVSHKLLRWLAPIFMLVVFVTNLFLLTNRLYQLILFTQLVFYSIAIIAALQENLRKSALFYFPYYFCSLNLAATIGLKRFLTGKQTVRWEKITR
jgi:cellulose synthase/poly-beta-1,6-N-acetylglucosamine synthase-like glycosyltransferase